MNKFITIGFLLAATTFAHASNDPVQKKAYPTDSGYYTVSYLEEEKYVAVK